MDGGEHTVETDLTRHHQVLKEGDKFKSSILRFDMSSDCLRSGLLSRKRKQVVSEQLSYDRIHCTTGGKKSMITEDEMG